MINIQTATKDDYKAIYKLQLTAYVTENELYDYTIPPLLQSEAEAITDCERSLVLKALSDGEIVGSIRGYEENNTCYINKLMVKPSFRCHGIGTALLAEIENHFPTCDYELFTGTKSLKNIALYEKNGYKTFRTDTHKELVYMKKPCILGKTEGAIDA